MQKTDVRFTYEDCLQLPDDKRYEVLEGELYMVPVPNIFHQRVSRNLLTLIWNFVKKNYGKAGVQELWFVDLKAYAVEVWNNDAKVFRKKKTNLKDDFIKCALLPGLNLEVAKIFKI